MEDKKVLASTEAQRRANLTYLARNKKLGRYRLQVWIPRKLRKKVIKAIDLVLKEHDNA